MELILSGNMLMIKPWLPVLEQRLYFWRRVFNPTKKAEMVRENMYWTHVVDGVNVGYVPDGLSNAVVDFLQQRGISFSVKDLRKWRNPPPCDLRNVDAKDLREGQDIVLAKIASHYNGVVVAPTGYGKSYLIQQICRMYPKLNIVICTPRKAVVKTLYDRLEKDRFLEGQIGVISSWKNTGPDFRVVVSTVRSLLKTNYEKCDILLFDECQGVAAPQTAQMLSKFRNARKFGFSASPGGRSDGADMVLEALFGPVIFDFSYQQAVDTGSVVPIEVHIYRVPGYPIDKKGKVALKRWGLWRNPTRNKLIAEVAKRFGPDEQVLIMVETVEHAMNLKKELPEYSVIYSNCSKERYQKYLDKEYTSDPYLSEKEMTGLQNAFEQGELLKVVSTQKWREG